MNLQGVQRQTTVQVSRRVIPMTFSRDFESLLLGSELQHRSLSSDIEVSARNGIIALNEFFDVSELVHTTHIKELIVKTVPLSQTDNQFFPHWHISIAEDLLDEVDLMMLTHGDDIQSLGLDPICQSRILLLLSVSGCTMLQERYMLN